MVGRSLQTNTNAADSNAKEVLSQSDMQFQYTTNCWNKQYHITKILDDKIPCDFVADRPKNL